jgi:hypothetical protein
MARVNPHTGRPMVQTSKTIKGPVEVLERVQVRSTIWTLSSQGLGVESLRGVERFRASKLRWLSLKGCRCEDPSPLVGLRDQLTHLDVAPGRPGIDVESIGRLTELQELSFRLSNREDVESAASAWFGDLTHLDYIMFIMPEDYGVDFRADWVPHLTKIRTITLINAGFRDGGIQALVDAPTTLKHVRIKERSPEQVRTLTKARPDVDWDTWEPPEPQHGRIFELDGSFFVTLGFPGAEDGMAQEVRATKLFAGAWKDLADRVTLEQDGDSVYVTSTARDALEELLRRARAKGVV